MLEIRPDRERFQAFVGELFGKDAAKARAKLLARNIAAGAREVHPNEFQAAGLEAPKALHRES